MQAERVIDQALVGREIARALEEEASQAGETGRVVAEPEIALVLAGPVIGLVAVEQVTVPVAGPQIGLVAAEQVAVLAAGPQIGLVAEVLGIDQVEEELELVPEAELERDHPRDQLEVLVETRSVIVRHLRGLQLLAAEDLAAVAVGTMREPAAAEVVVAWVAAE